MALPNWLDENSLRHYPLAVATAPVMSGVTLPTQTIVDLAIDVSPLGGDPKGEDPVRVAPYLKSIARTSSTLTFTVADDSPALTDNPLAFDCPSSAAPWTTITAGDTFWSGQLTVGDLGPLLAVLSVNATILGGTSVPVEPCVVTNWRGQFVRSLNLANLERITVATAEPPTTYVIRAEGLTGDPDVVREFYAVAGGVATTRPTSPGGIVLVAPGYNMTPREDDAAGAITLDAAIGGGLGEPCAEIPLHDPPESPPPGSPFLSGGLGCAALITTINGRTGPVVSIRGRNGVSVARDPDDPHGLIVAVDASTDSGCTTS